MLKRGFDIIVAGLFLLLLAPLILVLSGLIASLMGCPVIFKQQRPGLNGKAFYIYKFRSMNNKKNSTGELLPDAERLSVFGRALRASSLDELPSLWNVIKGDLSLVGPRPLLMEYLPLYNAEQARRHKVKPGVTGWAQVNGRNAISWEEKFKFDLWYVDHQSFWLDMKILAMTVKKVLIRDGISANSNATMPKFTGSKSAEIKSAEVNPIRNKA